MGRSYLPKALRTKVLERFGGRCGYCGHENSKLHIDHIVPVAATYRHKGVDLNDESNLMPACAPCNNYKLVMSLEVFRGNLQRQVSMARQYSVNYRFAERYGLVVQTDKPIVFHFEKETPMNNPKPKAFDAEAEIKRQLELKAEVTCTAPHAICLAAPIEGRLEKSNPDTVKDISKEGIQAWAKENAWMEHNARADLTYLLEENVRLMGALEFYANGEHVPHEWTDGSGNYQTVGLEDGERARAALGEGWVV